MLRFSAVRTSCVLKVMTSVQACCLPPTFSERFFVYASMNSFHGCTGAIKCETSLRARPPLRTKGAARVHGESGAFTELLLLAGEVGLLGSIKGRLRWEVPLGVGCAEDSRGVFKLSLPEKKPDLIDPESGVGTPVLELPALVLSSSLSQPLLRLRVICPGATLLLEPMSLLRRPIAGSQLPTLI